MIIKGLFFHFLFFCFPFFCFLFFFFQRGLIPKQDKMIYIVKNKYFYKMFTFATLNNLISSAIDDIYISIYIVNFFLASHFPKCRRSDPNLQECLLKATEQVRPDIRKGIPDFLPGIEKFVIPEISMQQGTRAVNYKAFFRNVTVLGLDQYKFTRYE